eukprot:7116414-Karenia_brevis.AAC.1
MHSLRENPAIASRAPQHHASHAQCPRSVLEDISEDFGCEVFDMHEDLGPGGMDEDSDAGDPEAGAKEEARALRTESADQQNLVQAVQGALDCRRVLNDWERALMALEDVRSVGR